MSAWKLIFGNEEVRVDSGLQALIVIRNHYKQKKINDRILVTMDAQVLMSNTPLLPKGKVAIVGEEIDEEVLETLNAILDGDIISYNPFDPSVLKS